MSLWTDVDRLVDDADDLAALRVNGLHLLAARRWRATGRPVPPELVADERAAAITTLIVPTLLKRVRALLNGPIVLLKGTEVAARYPDPALRPVGDLDLLVPDAVGAEQLLLAAGFEPTAGEETLAMQQHRPPLRWPTSPLPIEIHLALPVPGWATPPSIEQLLAVAVPASGGVDGILTLPPAHHALVLAAHSWVHYGPRPRVRDLIDVAAMAEAADSDEIADLARAWGLQRVWATTLRSVEALRHPSPARTSLRHGRARTGIVAPERTVAHVHVVRWLGALWAPTLAAIPRAVAVTVGQDLRPRPDESWAPKLARLQRAIRNAFVTVSKHRESA